MEKIEKQNIEYFDISFFFKVRKISGFKAR